MKEVEDIVYSLVSFIETENYQGWDPYDALNSQFINKITVFHPLLQRAAIHLLRISPFNVRPYLSIPKGYNPTSISLFIDAYVNLYKIYSDKSYLEKCDTLKNTLYSLSCIDNENEIGWGRNYKFLTAHETHDVEKPLTFLNAKLMLSLLNLYEVTQEKDVLENTRKAIFSIIKNGKVFRTAKGVYVGYSADSKPRYIYNATVLVAELIVKYLYCSKQDNETLLGVDLKKLAREIIDTIIGEQHVDGKWYYGYTNDFQVLSNIDFHQGFVTDSLLSISKYFPYRKKRVLESYQLGVKFLNDCQINDRGAFKWRFPKTMPIDIHNQAQGIISLSRCELTFCREKLSKSLNYTIDNFYDPDRGYFYYQKNKFYTNKIPYIRWGQGWMLLALTEYMKNMKEK